MSIIHPQSKLNPLVQQTILATLDLERIPQLLFDIVERCLHIAIEFFNVFSNNPVELKIKEHSIYIIQLEALGVVSNSEDKKSQQLECVNSTANQALGVVSHGENENRQNIRTIQQLVQDIQQQRKHLDACQKEIVGIEGLVAFEKSKEDLTNLVAKWEKVEKTHLKRIESDFEMAKQRMRIDESIPFPNVKNFIALDNDRVHFFKNKNPEAEFRADSIECFETFMSMSRDSETQCETKKLNGTYFSIINSSNLKVEIFDTKSGTNRYRVNINGKRYGDFDSGHCCIMIKSCSKEGYVSVSWFDTRTLTARSGYPFRESPLLSYLSNETWAYQK